MTSINVQVSKLEYKKNLLDVVPTISDIKQIVVFNRQIFALNNTTGKIDRLSETNVWTDVSPVGIITNHLLPVGDLLYAGTDTGLYVWQGNTAWNLIDDGTKKLFKLISFGGFIHAIRDLNRKIDRWVGTSWSQVGAVPVLDVQDLSVFNDQLYSGGASGVRRWTGSSWSQLGSITAVNVLHIYNNQLHAATSASVYRWTGSSWIVLQDISGVNSMATLKGGLYASNTAGVYKRVGLSWTLITELTGIRSMYPLGPVLLLANSGSLRRLTSATFSPDGSGNTVVSLMGHGFIATDEVFVKCITGGFVSTTFTVASPLIDSFRLTPSPEFVVKESLNYTRDGTALTVKYPGHGLKNGNSINIVSPVSPSLTYSNPLSVNVLDDNEFNVSVTGGTSTIGSDLSIQKISGEVLVAKMDYETGTITRNNASGAVEIVQTNHGYVKGDSIYVKITTSTEEFDSSPSIVEKVLTTGSYQVVKKMDPGSFYSKFGVTGFHEDKIYGRGVSIYVIDEGFNDTDPNIPGIQPISDLADFETIDFGDNGAGTSLSHGGLVGGLLGASRKNGAGIIGVSPDAKLYLADVDDTQGAIFISKVVQAIDDAVVRGVDIINMSLGTAFSSSSLNQAVQRALNANIIIFASAGNSGSSIYEYPAAFDGVISVASVNYDRQPSSFNTRNDKVAIFAPGENYPLPSPVSEQTIVRVDGTSFSSPFAAGLTALYIQKERVRLGDPLWRPTREEIVRDIPLLLGTQSLSYSAPGITPTDLFSGDVVETLAYVGVALVGIAIIAIIAMKIIK